MPSSANTSSAACFMTFARGSKFLYAVAKPIKRKGHFVFSAGNEFINSGYITDFVEHLHNRLIGAAM